MLYRIIEACVRPGYRVWVRFEDGTAGEADLSDMVGKGIFARWSDPAEFARLFVGAESGTLEWPGGLDVAPDALYEEIRGAGATVGFDGKDREGR